MDFPARGGSNNRFPFLPEGTNRIAVEAVHSFALLWLRSCCVSSTTRISLVVSIFYWKRAKEILAPGLGRLYFRLSFSVLLLQRRGDQISSNRYTYYDFYEYFNSVFCNHQVHSFSSFSQAIQLCKSYIRDVHNQSLPSNL